MDATADGFMTWRRDYPATIDKSTWGEGPWQREPDRLEFECAGFPCLVVRHPSGGHLCGYIAVPPGHPWHGAEEPGEPDCHGGVTYSRGCHGPVCHVATSDAADDVWWLGFDAAHLGDISPGTDAKIKDILGHDRGRAFDFHPGIYRTIEYMRLECEMLAMQAAAKATETET